MPQFQAKGIPDFSWKFVIGTSRTNYFKPALVKSTVPSYRGATLQDLHETVLQCRPKRLKTVTIIALMNDGRKWPHGVGTVPDIGHELAIGEARAVQLRYRAHVCGSR